MTPIRVTSEFHIPPDEQACTVKFSTYLCVGPTRLGIEVDDATVPGALLPTEGLDEPLVPLRGVRCIYEQELGGDLNGYVADPMSKAMRPPHVVGAALVLTLACGGRSLALGSEYDEFADVAHLDAFESADGVVRRLRRLGAGAP